MLGERLATPKVPLPPRSELRRALAAYEDQLLGRLATDRRLLGLRDALSRLPQTAQPSAVALTCALLVERIGFSCSYSPQLPPSVIRQLEQYPIERVLERGYASWSGAPDALQALAEDYTQLAAGAQTRGDLLSDAMIFAAENIDLMVELGQHVAASQIISAAEMFLAAWPRAVKPRQARGHAAISHDEASSFPAGGFSSMSNSGSLENIVSSELIYMDPGDPVDLFNVRYAEGELLYYTRDEGILARPERFVHFVFDPGLTTAGTKDRGSTWQRIVLLCGLLTALVRRLVDILGDEALELYCVFPIDAAQNEVLARERMLVELVLREWRDKGSVLVKTLSPSQLAELMAEQLKRGLVQSLRFMSNDTSLAGPAHEYAREVETHEFFVHARNDAAWVHDARQLLEAPP